MHSHRKPNPTEAAGGFTLLEMMIAVTIMAFLSLMALQNFQKQSGVYNLDRTWVTLSSSLRQAQVEAITKNASASVSLDTTIGVLTIECDSDHNGSITSDERRTVSFPEMALLTVTKPSLDGAFQSSGAFVSPSSSFAFILSTADGDSRYVYVFKSGQVVASKTSMTS